MVETLVDLRERTLRDDGKIIAARFDLYRSEKMCCCDLQPMAKGRCAEVIS
jgi:hypothetical protein